ncbi:MAG: hypothetical protein ACE5JD_06040 [Candidatus Methylomirabilia bacterium]
MNAIVMVAHSAIHQARGSGDERDCPACGSTIRPRAGGGWFCSQCVKRWGPDDILPCPYCDERLLVSHP